MFPVPSSIFSSNRSIIFPLRVAVTALVIIFGYGLFVGVMHPDAVISYDSGLRNRIVAEQYADQPVKKAVLVGSSLGARLTSDVTGGSYLDPDIFDLAMLGQNSATGLDVVLRKIEKPHIILVEMNILEHPYDPNFGGEVYEEPWRLLRRMLPVFRLENRPFDLGIVALEKTLKFGLTRAGLHSVESVYSPQSQGAERDKSPTQNLLGSKLGEIFLKNVDIALNRLGEEIELLRSQNIKVILLRFPVDPSFDATPQERYKRDKAYERFPQNEYRWYDLSSTGTYQTMDGQHLTSASARDLAVVLRKIVDTNAEPDG